MIDNLQLTEEEKKALYESALLILKDFQFTNSEINNEMNLKDIINQKKIDKMQIKQHISMGVANKLIADLPESNNMYKYEKQLNCQNTINFKNGTKTAWYCKQRFCPTCASIQMGIMINNYRDSLKECKDLHFLTVTAKTVNANQISYRIAEMQKFFSRILKNNTEHNRKQPNRKLKIKGLRKLEVIVAKDNKYHCHYHILVEGYEAAAYIRDNWVKKWKQKSNNLASHKAQDIRPVTDFEKSLQELAKYVAKPSYRQKETNKAGEEIKVTSQQRDNILTALYKVRTFKPFGKLKKTSEEYQPKPEHRIFKPFRLKANEYVWKKGNNWYDKTGNKLGLAKGLTDKLQPAEMTTKLERLTKQLESLNEKFESQKSKKNEYTRNMA